MKNCRNEISSLCFLESEELADESANQTSGKVMSCLKEKYMNGQLNKRACRSAFKNTAKVSATALETPCRAPERGSFWVGWLLTFTRSAANAVA